MLGLSLFALQASSALGRLADAQPTQTPAPIVAVEIIAASPSFELQGKVGTSSIRTSLAGYAVLLRINGNLAPMVSGQPIILSNVNCSLQPTYLSRNALLLCFCIQNSNADARTVDISVSSDIYFDGNDYAPITALSDDRGFVIYSAANALSFVGRGAPLVNNISTYWFGAYSGRSAYNWTQTNRTNLTDVDSAMSFSWQGIEVPAQSSVTRSMIIQFGVFKPVAVSLSLTFPDIPSPLHYQETLNITGLAVSANATDAVSILVMEHGDRSRFWRVPDVFAVGATFEFGFRPADYELGEGTYTVSFYAVNWEGSVSEGVPMEVTVAAPTRTPLASFLASQTPVPTRSWSPMRTRTPTRSVSRSPSVTRTVSGSRTPTPTRSISFSPSITQTVPATPTALPTPRETATPLTSRTPLPTPTPAPIVAIGVTMDTPSFDIIGLLPDGDVIDTTFHGYSAILRVNGSRALIARTQPARLGNLTLSMSWQNIASNAVVLQFALQNAGAVNRTADIGIRNDASLENDNPTIATIGASNGFIVSSVNYAMTFVLRRAAFVTDVSTYWFGVYTEMEANNWTQVTNDSITGKDSAMTLSWQNISVPAFSKVVRSFIVKFGTLNAGAVGISLGYQSPPDPFQDAATLVVTVTPWSVNASDTLSLLLVIDGDTTTIERWSGYRSNVPRNFSLRPADYNLEEGRHVFTFALVNPIGSLSEEANIALNIVGIVPTPVPETVPATETPVPTAPPHHTPEPTLSASPPPSVSASPPSVSASPQATFVASTPLPSRSRLPSRTTPVPLTLAPTITDNFETVVGTATASPFTSSQALAGLESGPNVGIIVGVSVGGVVLAICVVVGALLCCRKRPLWYSLKETEVSQFNSNIATTLMDPKIADLI